MYLWIKHTFMNIVKEKLKGIFQNSELEKRNAFVEEHLHRTASWWEENMILVIDGVTLTMAPKPLGPRQRHMAQSIKHTWMLQGETQSPDLHTFNTHGVQLGASMPLCVASSAVATSRCASGRRGLR